MSLTSLLSSKHPSCKPFQELLESMTPIAADYKTYSNTRAFSNYPTLVPYSLRSPNDAALVGIAFDYLARLLISRYTNTKINLKEFYCQGALLIIKNGAVNKKMEYHCDKMQSFLNGEYDKTELMQAVFFCAILEDIRRGGNTSHEKIETLFTPPNEIIIQDLISLGNLFYKQFIRSGLVKPDSFITFNPTFSNKITLALKGIDADICIDNVLYDFKVTKSTAFQVKQSTQLIAYYLFYLIDSILKHDGSLQQHTINRIALYKGRHGQTEYFDVSVIPHPMMSKALFELSQFFNFKLTQSQIEVFTQKLLNERRLSH